MPKIRFSLLLCSLISLTSGCTIGPAYPPSVVEVAPCWKAAHAEPDENSSTPPSSLWWQVFDDELLTALIEEAVGQNPSLYASLQRVIEARALAKEAGSPLYPHLEMEPYVTQENLLFKLFLPPNTAFPAGFPIDSPYRISRQTYALPFNLRYEIDLWGKLRGEYRSGLLSAAAEVEAFKSAYLTLTADLATAYFQLRGLDSQIELLLETIATEERSLSLANSRFNKGLTQKIDVANQELVLANYQNDLFELERQRKLQENMIAMLLGRPASAFSLPSHPLTQLPPTIPPGLTTDLLLRRPDIAEAERNRAAQHALIGPAMAAFLPSLSLTSALGWLSPDFNQFLRSISRLFTLAVVSNEKIFDGGKNCAELQQAWARFRQADGQYQQTVYTAFREVEDALSNLEEQSKQWVAVSYGLQAANKRYALSESRYKKGVAAVTEMLESRKTKIDSERSLASLLTLRYLSTVVLIKSLGGSWATCQEEAS